MYAPALPVGGSFSAAFRRADAADGRPPGECAVCPGKKAGESMRTAVHKTLRAMGPYRENHRHNSSVNADFDAVDPTRV